MSLVESPIDYVTPASIRIRINELWDIYYGMNPVSSRREEIANQIKHLADWVVSIEKCSPSVTKSISMTTVSKSGVVNTL